jgi:serine/threonine-protein kinase
MTAAADRDLLFGLLALQNGLIDQVQLVAAFQAWTREKSKSLADHLLTLGHLNKAQRAVVEAMADLHVAKHGDIERSLAAIPAGRSTQQSLAQLGDPDIEGTLAQVRFQATDQDGEADNDPDHTATYSVGSATSDGLRFRVLRPHARGGLGTVFVALDNELHREVALKQILDSHADDPVSRQRFVLEAEVTGGLEHPGIVPVYGLGTYDGGRPYYAMRFIRGDSLKEAIDRFHKGETLKTEPGRRSLELRKLLRRFTDVCNAIEYAHSRGVLHRDIKPGNIIVGKHGETLVVDWGLAKATGRNDPVVASGERALIPSSASGSAETLPGSTLGTPAYMSPEQAEGEIEHLGPRSDVYSLGATLYYLLTGRPPVEGDIGEVLRAVQRGEFSPPRRLDATIDPALEAVCLKAMAHRPADRYHSPKGLAEDIERWMADEPVSAWREPISRRVRRWANRNRTAVASAAVALVAGVVGLSAVLAVQTRAKAEVTRALAGERDANQALAAANQELARTSAKVKGRYDLAVDAIKMFYTGVSEDFLLKEEKFKDLRDRLLTSASGFYSKLRALLGNEKDYASRRALTHANFELAALTNMVGRKEDALAAHRAVLAAREALAAAPGTDAATKAEVGLSLNAVADLLRATNKTDEALATYHRSETLLKGLAEFEPSARAALAVCRTQLGFLLYLTGKPAEALAVCKLALADQEVLAAAPDASDQARDGLAATHVRIGVLILNTGKMTDSEAELRAALAIQQKLADDNPGVLKFHSSLAYSHYLLGAVLTRMGRPSEAQCRAALAIQQKLADANPAVSDFRRRLAMTYLDLGTVLQYVGKPTEGEAESRKALEIFQKLAHDNPADRDFRFHLGDAYIALSRHLLQAGKPAEAEAADRMGLAILRKLADENPDLAVHRLYLAVSVNSTGWRLAQTGRSSEAEAAYREAMAILQKLSDDNPNVSDYRRHLANFAQNLSIPLRRLGRTDEARQLCKRAVATLVDLVRENPELAEYRDCLAETYLNRGMARRALGDAAGAAADLREALALFESLPSRWSERWFLSGCAHAALAGLAGRAGSGVSAAEATSAAETAVAELRDAIAEGYRNPDAYRCEDALDPIRNLPAFRGLIIDLAFPNDPFGHAQ